MSEVALPGSWMVCKFTEMLDVNGGTQPAKKEFIYEPQEGYVRLLQIRDFGKKPVPTYVPVSKKLRLCKESDVLIGRYGASVGRICTGMDGAYNVALAKVVKPEKFSSRYLKHYLESPSFQLPLSLISRSAQNGFNRGDLSEIDLYVAPENEQDRIANKLDELLAQVDTIKARVDAIPAILKRFRQSVLAAAVSGGLTEEWREEKGLPEWLGTTFGELISEGPQNGLYKPKDLYGQGTRIIRIDGFYDGELVDWQLMKRLSVDDNELDRWGVRVSDILVNRVNSIEYLGKSAIIRELPEDAVFESNIMRIRLDVKKADPEYIVRFLSSHLGLSRLRGNAKLAINQASINQQDVKSCKIELPSLEEQEKIVQCVEHLFVFADQTEKRVNDAQSSINKLTQSVLAKAFRGELVPQDSNDEPASELLARIQNEREEAVALTKATKKTTRKKTKS